MELSYLSFFDQFRKIYVGDQAQKTSKVCCRTRTVQMCCAFRQENVHLCIAKV